MLSDRYGISIQIRHRPRQRRKIPRALYRGRQSEIVPQRPYSRTHRRLPRPARRIRRGTRGPDRRPSKPSSARRRHRRGPGPQPSHRPLAPGPHRHHRNPPLRKRALPLPAANRRAIRRNRRPRPPRLRLPETSRPRPIPRAVNALRKLAHPSLRPYVQASPDHSKITKRTQACEYWNSRRPSAKHPS